MLARGPRNTRKAVGGLDIAKEEEDKEKWTKEWWTAPTHVRSPTTTLEGQNLIDGNMKGKVISEYRRPRPPHGAGYHRYQFFLYEQPVGEDISMTDRERGHYGSWDMDKFVENFHLGTPEATTQFMTKNV